MAETPRVMTRSRVSPLEWVGAVTACVSEKSTSSVQKVATFGALGVSMWRLRSPVMTSQSERVRSLVRKSQNFSRNLVAGPGGR